MKMPRIAIQIPSPVFLADSPWTSYLVSDVFTTAQEDFVEKDCVASDSEETSPAVTTTLSDSSDILLRRMSLEAILGQNFV
jgi:hypothetical protein